MKIFVKKNFRRKIDKLPFFAELWIFGRNRQMRLEKLPPKFRFSTLYDFWWRGERDSFNFFPDFRPKMTSTVFVFWLKVICTRGDKYWKIPLMLAHLSVVLGYRHCDMTSVCSTSKPLLLKSPYPDQPNTGH